MAPLISTAILFAATLASFALALVLARVVERDGFQQRWNQMHAGIERARARAGKLADAHAGHAAGHHDDAQAEQERNPGDERKFTRQTQANSVRRNRGNTRARGEQAPVLDGRKNVIGNHSDSTGKQPEARREQQVLQQKHVTPFPGRPSGRR